MTRDFKILNNLATLAEGVEPINSSFRITAALYHRGSLISYGFCAMKSHPFQKKYGKNEEAIYIHAENSAIVNFLRKMEIDDLKKATMYVSRIKKPHPKSKEYIWGLAHPCEGCMRAINSFNLKKVVFTCDGEWNGSSYGKNFQVIS